MAGLYEVISKECPQGEYVEIDGRVCSWEATERADGLWDVTLSPRDKSDFDWPPGEPTREASE